jgi:hypothetical protein
MYKVLVGKPEGKRPLGRPRRRWEDGIRMDLREIGWGSVEWIQLAQDRDRWLAIVNTVMNLRVLAPRSLLVCFFVCLLIAHLCQNIAFTNDVMRVITSNVLFIHAENHMSLNIVRHRIEFRATIRCA